MTTKYRYIGKGTTDSNGIAHMTEDADGQTITGYTGTGRGLTDIIASTDDSSKISDSSIQSAPYNVIDGKFRDGGRYGDKNNNWTTSNLTAKCDSGDTYTTLSNSSSSNGDYIISATVDYITPFVMEFDNHLTSDDKDYVFFYSPVRNTFFNFSSRNISGNCHVKIIVDENIRVFVDGVEKQSLTLYAPPTGFRFRIMSGGADIGYSNFVIYPI